VRGLLMMTVLLLAATLASSASANWLALCTSADGLVPCQGCGTTAAQASEICFAKCYYGSHAIPHNVNPSNCTPESLGKGTHPEFVRTQVFSDSKGCLHIWWHQIYYDEGYCQNPTVAGEGEIRAYEGEWTNIISLVIEANDCVVTAFTDNSIWKSCDGTHLNGGGNSIKLYPPPTPPQSPPPQMSSRSHAKKRSTVAPVATVSKMIPCREGGLRVAFKTGGCYMTPSGDYPGGGGDSRPCAPGDMCTRIPQ
jgi:hypothetical protein